ncbi:hypothetical protein FPZ12_005140 [Amycolatopsis acidicola]|uniref:Uncharacterized protein n=1 Tax=Amycolatopsis acidicola TaxID=2596893 RepID=A0A5N0VK38_9PSEU|nr:hypothetical protein [Amycolatopsis acidicola]KAA9165863.1 hypothetical protein FPZ12_005140 [Amycolatopsis acidicola]
MAKRGGGGGNAGLFGKIAGWFRKPVKTKLQKPPPPNKKPVAPPPHKDPNPVPPPKTGDNYPNERPLLDKYKDETDPNKEPFPGQSVQRLDDQRREEHRMYVDQDGNMRYAKDGTLFDTSTATDIHSDGGRAIFTMDRHGNIYASNYQGAGDFHHSTLANGQPISAAGEMTVKNGKITHVNNNSGHYMPQIQQSANIIDELNSHGINPPVYMHPGHLLNGPDNLIANLR